MRWVRRFAAILLVAVSALATWKLVLPRHSCNQSKTIVNSAIIRLGREPADFQRTSEARELVRRCLRCLEVLPNDYEFHLLLGSAQGLLGDFAGAERSYRHSLELNERPETYAYLALIQLEQGKTDGARQNLYHAALFNLGVVELVTDPLRTEVYRAVVARHATLGVSPSSVEHWVKSRRERQRKEPTAD